MRVRDLESRLLALGWAREPDKGGVTVAWRHPSGRRLTFHRPHGTSAKELKPSTARAIMRRLERLEGQAR